MTTTLPILTLHHLNRSRSQRILWLLEELSLPYKFISYTRLPNETAPPTLKAIHPLGKAPVLEVFEPLSKKKTVLAESGNIVEYISTRFGLKKLANEKEDRERYLVHYAEGSLMNLVGTGALKEGIRKAPVPFFIKPFTGKIAQMLETEYLNHNFSTHLAFLEEELERREAEGEEEGGFVGGKALSKADFMLVFPLEACTQIGGLTAEKYPRLWAYLERMKGREAYQRAIDRVIKETGEYTAGIF